ncbi:hypothetical protein PVAP13_3NG143711 [Panicum virgatum]|uniref:Uncharacterized protein n=1 Tax=Panicum virgatum TaxID=38727 RepID=A0A8T0U759_PANVG|nr:hypothetical protein PVAP13_3NG143711 [Panicum virgatum]
MDVFTTAVTGTRPRRRRPACRRHTHAVGHLCAPLRCATERRGNARPRSPPPRPPRCRSPAYLHESKAEQSRARDSGDGGSYGCPAPRLPRAPRLCSSLWSSSCRWPLPRRAAQPLLAVGPASPLQPLLAACPTPSNPCHHTTPVPHTARPLLHKHRQGRRPWELVGSSARAKRRRVKGLGRFGGGRWNS